MDTEDEKMEVVTEANDQLTDAAMKAADEAKLVLVRHAKEQATGGDGVALVMLATIEIVGSMIGAGLVSGEPDVAKATLGFWELHVPQIVEQLRRKVEADDKAKATIN